MIPITGANYNLDFTDIRDQYGMTTARITLEDANLSLYLKLHRSIPDPNSEDCTTLEDWFTRCVVPHMPLEELDRLISACVSAKLNPCTSP
jgi:hypothetical protein